MTIKINQYIIDYFLMFAMFLGEVSKLPMAEEPRGLGSISLGEVCTVVETSSSLPAAMR